MARFVSHAQIFIFMIILCDFIKLDVGERKKEKIRLCLSEEIGDKRDIIRVYVAFNRSPGSTVNLLVVYALRKIYEFYHSVCDSVACNAYESDILDGWKLRSTRLSAFYLQCVFVVNLLFEIIHCMWMCNYLAVPISFSIAEETLWLFQKEHCGALTHKHSQNTNELFPKNKLSYVI